jgi:hypothetical protein
MVVAVDSDGLWLEGEEIMVALKESGWIFYLPHRYSEALCAVRTDRRAACPSAGSFRRSGVIRAVPPAQHVS